MPPIDQTSFILGAIVGALFITLVGMIWTADIKQRWR